ncbi:MAG: porin [Paracoccaceae bacterium]
MKKILLASTALVATAGFAAAEMTWTGSANMGMKYSDNGTTTLHNEIDLGMAATGETDGGIGWKVEMGLDSNTSDSTDGGGHDVGSVSVSGDFGTIRMGAVDNAATKVGLADVGYDLIGLDDAAELGRGGGTTAPDLQWDYSADSIALRVSVDSANDDMAAAASWTSGSLSITVAHAAEGATSGSDATSASISTSVGGFSVGMMAVSASTANQDSTGLSASMPVDGLGTVTFVTSANDTDAKSSYGVGFSKSLGGGATLKGGYGSVNGNDVGDIGVSFSF